MKIFLYHNISRFILRQCCGTLSNNTPKWIFILTACKTTNSIAVMETDSVNSTYLLRNHHFLVGYLAKTGIKVSISLYLYYIFESISKGNLKIFAPLFFCSLFLEWGCQREGEVFHWNGQKELNIWKYILTPTVPESETQKQLNLGLTRNLTLQPFIGKL